MPLSSNTESDLIYEHAYLPEQLPHYHETFNDARVWLIDNYICAQNNGHLTFIGFALDRHRPSNLRDAYCKALIELQPQTITLISEDSWIPEDAESIQALDGYYFLPFPPPPPDAETRYMMRRAQREIEISVGDFTADHQNLIDDFCASRTLPVAQSRIYNRLEYYCRRTPATIILQATRAGKPIAFSIIDMHSAHFAFYLFHFRSTSDHVPGVSDLLFDAMIYSAQYHGKTGINLGLGVNDGIRRFKSKWGGRRFMLHQAVHAVSNPTWTRRFWQVLSQGQTLKKAS